LHLQIYITNQITLKRYPEIIHLRKGDESDDFMSKLGYEEILIRWINYHIKRNGGDKFVKNIGSDVADGYGYGHVLRNVAPSLPGNYFDLDKNGRAVKIIETCKS
jgi:sulfatase maturation enzyme AslB (radical SAM superfamily)